MAATIKDIARESGVSIATVSRVLNHLGGYSSEVEAKVLTIAKELGYRKNENARSLVKNTSKTIGIIMPHVTTSFYGKIVNGIEDTAYAHGYSVIITHAGVEGERLRNSINLMGERRVSGVIVFSMSLAEDSVESLKQLGVPILLVSTEVLGTGIPYIKVDDYSASFAAVEYLITHGHTKIGLAGASPTDVIAGKPRIRGYLDALEKHQLTAKEGYIHTGDFSFEAGKQAMEHYIATKSDITAVACVSDEVAMGIISVCYKHQIRIPKDLSVIGYDDSEIASMATPPLTTIAQPFYEMGKIGCSNLIASINNGKEIVSQIIPFQLMERETVWKK